MKKVLILGVNGFIGNALVRRILDDTNWEVYGMDLATDKLEHSLGDPRFHFLEGDISISKEWIEYHIKKCDVVLPLVAIATPAAYVKRPLRVFELDFEENLRIVRQAFHYGKRVVFPSTSEVYGMCPDAEFDEDTSNLVVGPISKQRWIYSISKQLMDRVIAAYGQERGAHYTLIRPFNWIGPKLDSIATPKEGSSRVLTQFIVNLVNGKPIQLVDGGRQRRAFTYIDDGIDCVMRILKDESGASDRQIFNIGNPANECSVRELAEMLRRLYAQHAPKGTKVPGIVATHADEYYGKGYQDVSRRRPSVEKARRLLGWRPKVGLEEAVERTLVYFLKEHRRIRKARAARA